jgi:acyl-CoA synthetase (AMP-forming)/AMP-acid ligase II
MVVEVILILYVWDKLQVPPAELEHILQSHPDIADAAVIPYVSKYDDNILCLWISAGFFSWLG